MSHIEECVVKVYDLLAARDLTPFAEGEVEHHAHRPEYMDAVYEDVLFLIAAIFISNGQSVDEATEWVMRPHLELLLGVDDVNETLLISAKRGLESVEGVYEAGVARKALTDG